MLKDIITVDSVFEDPDSIRALALAQVFYLLKDHPNGQDPNIIWEGARTLELMQSNPQLFQPIVNHAITQAFRSTFGSTDLGLEFTWYAKVYFCQNYQDDVFRPELVHKDPLDCYAAVIYLSPNPRPHSGTVIMRGGSEIEIDNQYNRMVLYRADYPHSPLDGWGRGAEDCRLVMTLFISRFNIGLTNPHAQ
jgi:hypothetical protein